MFDILIHHGSSFEGDSIDTRPLGGTETSEIYLSREFAKHGLKVIMFCNCSKPGMYEGVRDLIKEFRNGHMEPVPQERSLLKKMLLWIRYQCYKNVGN